MNKIFALSLVLMACEPVELTVKQETASDSAASPVAKSAAAAAPDCSGNYTTGKTYQNLGSSNGMGHRRLIFSADCKISVPNCGQTLILPQHLNIQKDQTVHVVTSVEVTGTQGWDTCMTTGVKTCDITLVSFGTDSLFNMVCDGVQYSGTR